LRIKEQEKRLTLNEHDDDDDESFIILANTTFKLPEDDALKPKHLGNFNINLHHLFVHTLVYNKHLLFNMHGMNIKVKAIQQCVCRYPVSQRTV
jgi:hypothetical protein